MKTINEIFKEQNPQDGNVPAWAKWLVIAYAKQIVEECSKEAEDFIIAEEGVDLGVGDHIRSLKYLIA